MPISPARKTAFDILQLVEAGGYASDLLHARAAELDVRDAGLSHEIVFGVLRFRAQLDYLIAHYSARSGKLDPEVRTALRMGIYQLRYLQRIPAHAAVADTVQQSAKSDSYDRSVIDLVLEEAKSVRTTLSRADQQRLDEYLHSVRSRSSLL